MIEDDEYDPYNLDNDDDIGGIIVPVVLVVFGIAMITIIFAVGCFV